MADSVPSCRQFEKENTVKFYTFAKFLKEWKTLRNTWSKQRKN